MNKRFLKDAKRIKITMDENNLNWPLSEEIRHLHRVTMDDEMITSIQEKFAPHSTIIEFGSGESTLTLSEYYQVYSIEDKKEYLNKTSKATYIHAPLKFYMDKYIQRKIDWYDPNIIKKTLPETCDLIIIDGPDGEFSRYGIVKYYEYLGFKPETPVLIDDLQIPYIYMTALMLARKKQISKIDIHISSTGRAYGWLLPNE